MKSISILYSLLTLPIFALLDFILIPTLKYTHKKLDLLCDKMVKYNAILAIKSKRTECRHVNSKFILRECNENGYYNIYQCDTCRTYLIRYAK